MKKVLTEIVEVAKAFGGAGSVGLIVLVGGILFSNIVQHYHVNDRLVKLERTEGKDAACQYAKKNIGWIDHMIKLDGLYFGTFEHLVNYETRKVLGKYATSNNCL